MAGKLSIGRRLMAFLEMGLGTPEEYRMHTNDWAKTLGYSGEDYLNDTAGNIRNTG